jgi:hypothetical protein
MLLQRAKQWSLTTLRKKSIKIGARAFVTFATLSFSGQSGMPPAVR